MPRHAAQFLKGDLVMQDCVLFGWSNGWIALTLAWMISALTTLRYWYKHRRPESFFEHWPKGTDKWSAPAWLAYGYACISQLSPVGMISRIVSGQYSRLILDTYILSWGAMAIVALSRPVEEIFFWTPLFLWRFIEYTSIIIYQRIFAAGFPQYTEPDPERFYMGYRALIIDVVNYLQFVLIFATIYRANGTHFAPNSINSASDAIYFSVITMATVGYGDITPLHCMRTVALVQILFGIFMLAIIVGVLLGRRVLYPRNQDDENLK